MTNTLRYPDHFVWVISMTLLILFLKIYFEAWKRSKCDVNRTHYIYTPEWLMKCIALENLK